MKDLILIPTYNRPEILAICLERLKAADLIEQHEIWIEKPDCKNATTSDEIYRVIDNSGLDIILISKPARPIYDNFYDLFKDAYQTEVELVYLMEDDILVTKDFFRWHRQAMRQFDPFMSIGVNCWTHSSTPQSLNKVILSVKDYEQWGACIRRYNLPLIEREHERVLEEVLHNQIIKNRLRIIFPDVPRAYNVGFYGADSCEAPLMGSLEERINQAREKSITKPGFWRPFKETEEWSGDLWIGDIRS